MEGIREMIEDLEIQNDEKRSFIPYDSLQNVLNKGRVTSIVRTLSNEGKIQVYEQHEIIDVIINHGLRLFATLLYLSRPELVVKFVEMDQSIHNRFDSRLPLSRESLAPILGAEKLSARFYNYQWRFLAPVFRVDQSHRNLDCHTILPFIECQFIADGGFGEIHKITLPASHQLLLPKTTSKVMIIRKRLKQRRDTKADFEKEQHILSLLRCLQHPNIIQLLTTYTIEQVHHFLFPLADGDLHDFFRQQRRLPGFETDNRVFQALCELASAIEAIHNYFSESFNIQKIGCHYDLKPDNILYHDGKLMISDFGLSRLKDYEKGSRSLFKDGGGEYFAPECLSTEKGFKSLEVGRSTDIWSFGCILAEMLTYLQEGPCGVEEFSKVREITFAGFFTCKAFHGGNKPHDNVTRWLLRLSTNAKASIEQRNLMTVIKNLLQQEPTTRMKADRLTSSLFKITQREVCYLVKSLFSPLLIDADLELHILYERFQLWIDATDLDRDSELRLSSDGTTEHHSFAHMQQVRGYLLSLQQELENISEVCKNKSSAPYRVYYHVTKVVDSLWDMEAPSVQLRMANALEDRILDTDDKAQLKSIETAFSELDYGQDIGTQDMTPVPVHTQRVASYRRIGLLAAMKQIAADMGRRAQSLRNMLLDEKRLERPLRPFHWHHTGLLCEADGSKRQVLVEWLVYDMYWAKRKEELIQRVEDIASSRATTSAELTLPVLTCAGYHHHLAEHAFGMVYRFPPSSLKPPASKSDVEHITSLRDIFLMVKSRRERPSLDQIFDIAQKLIEVVLTMHRGGWLHKSISAYNIIFFPQRFDTIAEAMTSPYFIGFSYSRLNLETAFTQGPSQQKDYQHPEYLKNSKRFCQEYEYYSVGLVLLELGLWAPLEVITKDILGSPAEVRVALLKTHVPILKTYMGRRYEEAVSACLRGEFGGSLEAVEVRKGFERNVYAKILDQKH